MPNASPFYLAGPTASGKSEVAVVMAERSGAEIVSADAFQIYQGLDLLTAKPTPELLGRVRHHLISEVPLGRSFDVAQFAALATARLSEIADRGRAAIVVGGSGLHLRALMRGLDPAPAVDLELRAELQALSTEEARQRLTALDPGAAIDWQNPRRVVRALELVVQTGRPLAESRTRWEAVPAVAGAVLARDRLELHERIDARVEAMFREGVVEEVRAMAAPGETAAQTLGLREIQAHLAGEMSRAECIAAIQQATRQYAKRQGTWFRKEPGLRPVNATGRTVESLAAELLQQWGAA